MSHVARTEPFHKFKERATWHIRGCQIFPHTSTVAIAWRLTHLLHNRNYSKTRPLTLNSFIFSFCYTGRLYSIHYSLFSSFYLSVMTRSTIYININKHIKRRKNSFTTPMTKTTAITEYRAMSIC